MRKDVRLGFAVGGVLLAVIIVAILVLRHNKNAGKAVALDKGGSAQTADGSPNDGQPSTGADPAGGGSAPAAGAATSTDTNGTAASGAKPAAGADDAADKGGSRWDALFASSSDNSPLNTGTPATTSGETRPKHTKPAAASTGGTHRDTAAEAVTNNRIAVTPSAGSRSTRMLMTPATSDSTGSGDATRTHKVEPGETFVSIARRAAYGDGKYFQAIVDANPNVTPEKLKPGTVINLPPASQVKKAKVSRSASSTAPAVTDGKTYIVQKGDNLYRIARKLYGNGELEGELYTLNKQVIGPDSTRLQIGMVLKLPEKPRTATASSH